MNLNHLKDEVRKVKAPEVRDRTEHAIGGTADDLITTLKAHEAKEQRSLQKARTLWFLAIAFMGFAFVAIGIEALVLLATAPREHVHLTRVLLQGALFGAFLLAGLGVRKKLCELSKVDYTQPLRSFLDEAERRFSFGSVKSHIVTLFYALILGVGTGPYVTDLFFSRYLDHQYYTYCVVGYALFFLLIVAMGYYFTWKNWKRDKAPLLDEIRRVKKVLTNENSVDSESSDSE